MLVLSRKENEQIKIGNDIVITVVRIKGGAVRLGIAAPDDVNIRRGELAPRDGAISAGGEAGARAGLAAGQLITEFCG